MSTFFLLVFFFLSKQNRISHAHCVNSEINRLFQVIKQFIEHSSVDLFIHLYVIFDLLSADLPTIFRISANDIFFAVRSFVFQLSRNRKLWTSRMKINKTECSPERKRATDNERENLKEILFSLFAKCYVFYQFFHFVLVDRFFFLTFNIFSRARFI